MSDQDLQTSGSLSITAKNGLNDNNIISQTRSWYRLNGVASLDGLLERITGKRLSFKLAGSVLAIHSNNMGALFIQTNTTLYIYQASLLLAAEVTDDVDGSVVIDDATGEHVIEG